MNEIVAAKVRQAAELLREFQLPLWIVQFARESYDHPSPLQALAVGTTVTWPAAFVVTVDGRSTAIVGTMDVENVRSVGVYEDVVGYVKDVGPPLRELLAETDPAQIGVSFSVDDDQADSITHGMYVILEGLLEGTAYRGRLVAADRLAVSLRGRKLPIEVDRVRRAVEKTVEMFDEIEQMLHPGVTERAVSLAMHESARRLGATMAWDEPYDPTVNFGAASSVGHAPPGEITLEPGMLVHVDLGIKIEGYCSDLQRMWYILREGEVRAPDEVSRAFDTVIRSMQAGFEALRPGVAGWEVDAAARRVVVDAGYPEPEFSLGHQLGQTTHDGGALLGPRWPRYGNRPEMRVEEGNIFTLEYGLISPAGLIGVEEDVIVTTDGAEYLTEPQTELRYIRW